MTKDETKELLAIIRAAYPNFYKDVDDQTLKASVNIWAMALSDIDYSEVQRGFVQYVKTSKWPPTVAEIVQAAKDAHKGDMILQAIKQRNRLLGE